MSPTDWSKFRSLSLAERILLFRAIAFLPFVAIAIRMLGIKRSQTIIRGLTFWTSRGQHDCERSAEAANRMARAVNVAAHRGLFAASCLPRALMLWWLLRSHGIEGEIRYGALNREGRFQAHAWVELHGEVVGDRSDIGRVFGPFLPEFTAPLP